MHYIIEFCTCYTILFCYSYTSGVLSGVWCMSMEVIALLIVLFKFSIALSVGFVFNYLLVDS